MNSRILCALAVALLLPACAPQELPDVDSDAYRETVTSFYSGVAAVQAGEDVGGRESFVRASRLAPGEPATWANLGVLALRRNDFDEAAEYLERAQRLAPENDHIQMLLGLLAGTQGRFEAAAARYEAALEQNPSNLKAAYALVQELERQGSDSAEARALSLVQSLSERHPDNLALAVEKARLALKRGDDAATEDALLTLRGFSDMWPGDVDAQMQSLTTAVAEGNHRAAGTSLAFLRNLLLRMPSYRADLAEIQTPVEQPGDFVSRFLAMPEPPPAPAPIDTTLAFQIAEASFQGVEASHAGILFAGSESPPIVWALVGSTLLLGEEQSIAFPGDAAALPPTAHPVAAFDFDYDYNVDLVLAGPTGMRLLRGDGAGEFMDVTSLSALPPNVLNGAFHSVWAFDIDTEGDLDVVLGRSDGPPVVLRNNGDGSFSQVHLFTELGSIRSFAWADLDEDADPDAAIVDDDGALHIFLNDRGGVFRHVRPQISPNVTAVAVADIDADGRFELLAVDATGSILAIRGDEVTTLASAEESADRILVADVDNNGAFDLIAPGPGGTTLYLNGREGMERSRLATPERALAAADLDGDGKVDLLAMSDAGLALLRNQAKMPYRWQILRPRSAQATGDQRINSFGVGGQIEARAGLLFQKQVIMGPQVHFGLGVLDQTDVARVVWPNGDIQAEFALSADQALTAQQRLKGSCPWVFAYDGDRMAFVTDFIWRSPLGLAINGQEQAGVVLTADRIKIPGERLVARNGVYDIRITAELWETHFFDEVSLLVVDHPEGTEVFVDERFSIPAPELVPRLMKPLAPIQYATDHRGNDVTDVVAEFDERYLGTFARGRYQGVAEDHYVEIDLGADAPRGGSVWLVARGWVRPTDSSVNVAMSQGANPPPDGLRLEAQDERGVWHVVAENLGFPAGKTKTLLFQIGDVLETYPTGRLRLGTNLEIYWDALHWAEGVDESAIRVTRLLADRAELRYRGYSQVTTADASSPEIPHYDRFRSKSRQWFDLEGFYTRFGDVSELLEEVDDRYVIMNAGDEIVLEFAELPPPAPGYVRDFLLQGDGWVKDGDFNTTHSRTVRPLPRHEDTRYAGPLLPLQEDPGYLLNPSDWELYHTRYVAPDGFAAAMAP